MAQKSPGCMGIGCLVLLVFAFIGSLTSNSGNHSSEPESSTSTGAPNPKPKLALHYTAAEISAHLDTAERLIRAKGDVESISQHMVIAAADTSPATERRRLALVERLKPLIAADERRRAAARRVEARKARQEFARQYEDQLLDKGLNVTVTTRGDDATTLHVTWILVSKVVAHQISKGDLPTKLRDLGFRRLVMTDGYDETWTWNLTE